MKSILKITEFQFKTIDIQFKTHDIQIKINDMRIKTEDDKQIIVNGIELKPMYFFLPKFKQMYWKYVSNINTGSCR